MNTENVAHTAPGEALPKISGGDIPAQQAESHPAPALAQQTAVAQAAVGATQRDSQALMRMIEVAMLRPDFEIERMERLLVVKREWEADEARRAFAADMAAFKQEAPTIIKDKHVDYTYNGHRVVYDHASLGNVVEVLVEAIAKFGFSHRWIPRQTEGWMEITCEIKHRLGHVELTPLRGPYDQSGGKNTIQSIGSSVTYLERYSFLAALGLATKDDDDGKAAVLEEARGQASEHIANKILTDLLADLAATGTDAQALALWKSGSKSIHATGATQSYEEFKKAVTNHRNSLKKKPRVAA